MGLGASTEQPAGGAEGFHLHGVQENSPAQQAGLEPYFDFIITIGHSRLVRLPHPTSALLVCMCLLSHRRSQPCSCLRFLLEGGPALSPLLLGLYSV